MNQSEQANLESVRIIKLAKRAFVPLARRNEVAFLVYLLSRLQERIEERASRERAGERRFWPPKGHADHP
jgi:hypothetical protein